MRLALFMLFILIETIIALALFGRKTPAERIVAMKVKLAGMKAAHMELSHGVSLTSDRARLARKIAELECRLREAS